MTARTDIARPDLENSCGANARVTPHASTTRAFEAVRPLITPALLMEKWPGFRSHTGFGGTLP
jgi:hypothetical protein